MGLLNRYWTYVQLWCGLCFGGCSSSPTPPDTLDWAKLPSYVEPTQQQREINIHDLRLGRALFFEPRLSMDGSLSCASCHLQSEYFQDGRESSTGIFEDPLIRNSPSLLNIGWARYITWSNIAFFKLERHMLVPLFGDAPPEMLARFDDHWLSEVLASSPPVQSALLAHPDLEAPLTWPIAIDMIAKYMRSLTSLDAAWDRQQNGQTAMSLDALAGQSLFFSDKFRCSTCHTPPFFSAAYVSGDGPRPPVRQVLVNTGLYFLKDTESGYPLDDPGLMEFSGDAQDGGRFRIPSLRNVAFTAPYMHDGSIATLEEVLEHYAAGGRSIDAGPHAGKGSEHPNRDHRVRGFKMSELERDQLIAFLKSLSGADLGRGGLADTP